MLNNTYLQWRSSRSILKKFCHQELGVCRQCVLHRDHPAHCRLRRHGGRYSETRFWGLHVVLCRLQLGMFCLLDFLL